MSVSISAVVVTYNRFELLKKCIASIRDQVRKVDDIIIVNNSSTDGTEAWLKEQNDLIVVKQGNLGGAAGFYRGMKEAYERGADWIWIMDDDAFPDENCLQKLTNNPVFSSDKDVMLSPVVIEGNRIDYVHRGNIDFKKFKYPTLQERINAKKLIGTPGPIPISFASFVGILIGRNVVDKIGLPDYKFFISNDDVEYSIRLLKNKLPIYLIKDAIVFHRWKDENVKVESEADLANYVGETGYVQIPPKSIAKKSPKSEIHIPTYIGKRNLLYTLLKYNGINPCLFKFVIKDFRHFMWSFYYFNRVDRWKLIKLYFFAYKQGISGKFNNETFLSFRN